MYGKNFLDIYKSGKASMKRKYNPDVVDIKNIRYTFAKSTRDFMTQFGFSFKKGETGWYAQKIVNHGKYADLRLTENELVKADLYLKEKFGLDSDEYRFFWIAVESCSRISALMSMSLDYSEHTSKKTNKTTLIMTAFEKKTKHIKGGKWIKYITRTCTQEAIKALKARGGFKIYERQGKEYQIEDYMKKMLIQLYVSIGKIPNLAELQEKRKIGYKNTGNYWFDHAAHVLRHVGAHYWLSKKNYNYGLVAKLGGWNTIDELKNSYGEMPPEVVLELLEDEDKL